MKNRQPAILHSYRPLPLLFILLTLALTACSAYPGSDSQAESTASPQQVGDSSNRVTDLAVTQQQPLTQDEPRWLIGGNLGHMFFLPGDGKTEEPTSILPFKNEPLRGVAGLGDKVVGIVSENNNQIQYATYNIKGKREPLIKQINGGTNTAFLSNGGSDYKNALIGFYDKATPGELKVGIIDDTGTFTNQVSTGQAYATPPNSAVYIKDTKQWFIYTKDGTSQGVATYDGSSNPTLTPSVDYFGGAKIKYATPGEGSHVYVVLETNVVKKLNLSNGNSVNVTLPALNSGEKIAGAAEAYPGVLFTNKGRLINLLASPISLHKVDPNEFTVHYLSKKQADGSAVVVLGSTNGNFAFSQIDASFNATTPIQHKEFVPVLTDIAGLYLVEENGEKVWQLYIKETGVLYRFKSDLTPFDSTRQTKFDSNALINTATSYPKGFLIAGPSSGVDKTRYQLIDLNGNKITEPTEIDGIGGITAAIWTGQHFIIGTDKGHVATISEDGTYAGSSQDTGVGSITTLSQNDLVVLVGGNATTEGKIRYIRLDASLIDSDAKTIPDFKQISAAAFTGQFWVVGGATANDEGVLALIDGKDRQVTDRHVVPGSTPITALIHGTQNNILFGTYDGKIYIQDSDLAIGLALKKLTFFDYVPGAPVSIVQILDNKRHYLVVNELGIATVMNHTTHDFGPYYFLEDTRNVYAAAWSEPIGYPTGPCVQKSCVVGACIKDKDICCDSACKGACESCLKADTDQPDGVCAPVVEGHASIAGKENECEQSDAATCGSINVCDGNRACKSYDAGTECAAAKCEDGAFYQAASCPGSLDACPKQTKIDCAPYKGCDTSSGCATSCTTDDECVENYTCQESKCVEKSDSTEPPTETTPKEEETKESSGGCATTDPNANAPLFLLLSALGFFAIKRRRKTA